MESRTNPYRPPGAELDAGTVPRSRGSALARFLLASVAGTVVGAVSGGVTGALLTLGWRGPGTEWSFGLGAGAVLGAVGGVLVGAVLGLVAQTPVSARALAWVAGVLGALWALFFGGFGSLPMEAPGAIAVGAALSASVGGFSAVTLARFLRRTIGPSG